MNTKNPIVYFDKQSDFCVIGMYELYGKNAIKCILIKVNSVIIPVLSAYFILNVSLRRAR